MKIYVVNITPLYECKVFERHLENIDATRQKKVLNYRFVKDRALSLGVGLLLSYALRVEGINEFSLKFGIYGKPLLANSSLHFNLSHSGKYAACAIDDNVIGVDIESIGKIDYSIARKIFSPRECSYMQTDSTEHNQMEFYKHWTAKESYIKAIGTGLCLNPRDFEIIFDKDTYVKHDGNNTPFFCKLYEDIPNYMVSVCSPMKNFPKRVMLLEEAFFYN